MNRNREEMEEKMLENILLVIFDAQIYCIYVAETLQHDIKTQGKYKDNNEQRQRGYGREKARKYIVRGICQLDALYLRCRDSKT